MDYNFWGVLVILILLFLLGREFICWYFKINHRLDVLEEIRDSLKPPKPDTVVVDKKKKLVKVEDDFFYQDNIKK